MRIKLLNLYILSTIIIFAVYKIILNYNIENYNKNLLIESKKFTELTDKKFEKFINLIKLKLDAISTNKEFREYLLNQNNKQSIQELFLTTIKQTTFLSQLRFIDINGYEIIRVNQDDSSASIIDDNDLQNKSNRYYFKETLDLQNDDDYYISKIDLINENNKIVIPYKATVRISKILKNQDKEIGIIILNINLNNFLKEIIDNEKLDIYLFDKDEYLLVSNTKDKQWERYLELISINRTLLKEKSVMKKINLNNKDELYLLVHPNKEYFEKYISLKMNNTLILLIIFTQLLLIIVFFKIYQKELEDKIKYAIEENSIKEKILFEQQKLASMGEMLQNIAHQWRQPLSIISSLSSSMNLKLKFNMLEKEEQVQANEEIFKQTQHLSNTIETFRNFLKEKKEYILVDIEERIKLSLEILDATFKDNKIQLINNIDFNKKHKVTLVIGELSQVIINIVNNAKDAFKERKITNPIIEINLNENEKYLILTIEDNAGGIPEDILPKIFEPYFTTKGQFGTGIGLHMAYRIIKETFKGNIYAKNTNKGAKFIIEIPKNS